MLRYISIILFLSVVSVIYGQNPVSKVPGTAPDTVRKIPAATRSAHKADTTKHRILRQYTLSADYAEEVNTPIDTVFSLFNRFRIADRYSPVNATMGNYGLPFYQINFFDRITDPDKFLYSSLYPFMFLPDKPVFMNTQIPYTELLWTLGGKKETSEQTFRVRHSQNVNRFFNFGLIYDIIFSLGQYSYQRTDDKTAILYASYTGNKYKLYAAVGINNLRGLENGGVTDVNRLGQGNTRDVPVRFGGVNNAISTLKNRNFLLVQRYKIGGNKLSKADTVPGKKSGILGLSGTFSHILIIDLNKRIYSDSYPGAGFYDTTYVSSQLTYDSLYARVIKNSLRFDFETDETRKFRLGGGVGVRNEILNYSQTVLARDKINSYEMARWLRSNNVLLGRLFNSIGNKFRWTATGELYVTGYRVGDFNLQGEILKLFVLKKDTASWSVNGGINNRQPSFWYENWISNNFRWNNNMKKEFLVSVGSAIEYPARKLNLKFNYSVIKNYTDFDSTAMPSQYTGGLSVAAITFSKGLKAWKFHLDPDVIIQTSSNKAILDLPLATVRAAAYFEHLFRFRKTNGKLNTQLGIDVTYNTLYHPYAYMPATGRFYRQYNTEAGDYPFVNVFLNIKLQRTRFFFMLDHLNYELMGATALKNYSMIPGYPMNITMFRFGLAWTFYN